VAALSVSRQRPASSSAARRTIAARSCHGIADHERRASIAALIARSTSALPALW